MKFLFVVFFSLFAIACTTHSKTEVAQTVIDVPLRAEDVRPLLVGATIPDVNLHSIEGKTVSLQSLLDGRPTLIIFYRGGWCPYCNIQLGSLKSIEAKVKKLGVQIVAVTPDTPEELRKSIDKHHLKYTLVSDSKIEASRAFGISFRVDDETVDRLKEYKIDLEAASGENHHILPVPSLFAIKRDGTIAYTYVNPNYKIRPSAKVVLAIAEEIAKPEPK